MIDFHAGHFEAHKTLELLQRKYFWPKIAADVKRYVKDCKTCNCIKAACHKPYGLLQLLPAPSKPWKNIIMDFITSVLPSLGVDKKVYNAILVVVDRYTKLARYYSILKTITAKQFGDLFIHTVFCSFGVPSSIVSNQGSIFTCIFWSALCHYLCIKRRLNMAFYPQTNDQMERQNQTLKQYLHAYVNYQQDDWARLLPMAEYAYNNAINASISLTPFKALVNYNLDFDIEMSREPESASQDVQERIEELNALRRQLQMSWKQAQNAQEKYHNKKHLEKSFNVGNRIYLTAKNITTKKPSDKLNLKFINTFRILEPISSCPYSLELPTDFKIIYPVFHVSLLCKCCQSSVTGHLEALHDDNNKDPSTSIPETIFDSHHNFQNCLQYLVKWTGTSNLQNTWKLAAHLQTYPKLLQGFHQDFPEKPRDNIPKTTRGRPRSKGWGTSKNTARPASDNQRRKRTRGRLKGRPRTQHTWNKDCICTH